MKATLSVSMLALFLSTLLLTGCGKADLDDTDRENAQQIGDSMASIDESGSGGTIAMNSLDEDKILRDSRPLFARYGVTLKSSRFSLIPEAQALSCLLTSSYISPSCSSNTLVRTFGGCTVGLASFAGTVTLVWGGSSASCTMGATGDTITRTPSFTVTGLLGATLSVTQTGSIGQRLTWVSGTYPSRSYSFSNDGIRRVFTVGGTSLLDFTTMTTSNIGITGNLRSNRVINGGTLRVTNNLTGVVCDYSPSSVAWSSTCNCPTSGTWSGSCTDGKQGVLTLTGCGTADFEFNDREGTVNFDRCYGT